MSMVSRFEPLSPRIGAQALLSRREMMDPAFAEACLEALERYGVLIFPRLNLSDEEQVVFSGRLGDIIPQGGKRADGSRDPIFKVSLDPKHNEAAEYLKGTIYWHIDGATDDIPARATMLSARRVSEVGGQTEFCNTYAAYDDLPEAERPHYESLRIGHSLEAANRLTTPDPSEKELAIWRARGSVKEHPLVWRHKSGRKSLVLGATAGYIVGMSAQDSRALLAKLEAHATRRDIVYQHQWQVGDLVIWDNCGTMHRVIPYPASSGRMMHRTTLHGVEAIA
jgi:alpha-ketoglutarate-dependent taurine dioxygenase